MSKVNRKYRVCLVEASCLVWVKPEHTDTGGEMERKGEARELNAQDTRRRAL